MPLPLLLVGCLLLNGHPEGARQAAKDEKGPSAEHQALNALVGAWDVSIQFKIGPDRTANGKAACTSTWILDEHVVHQEYKSNLNGKPFTVLQWLGYDENKKRFFEIKMDNLDTGVMHNEGSLSADGKVLTQTGTRIDPASGKAGKMRTVLTFEDKDHYTLEWYMTGDDGREERTVVLKHTRKVP